MAKVGDRESITHNRITELFQQQLGYRYLGDWKDRNNSNIEIDLLHSFLRDQQEYSKTQIVKATYELQKVAGDQNKSLYDINKEVYTLLRYGIKIKEEASENNQTIWLIDWKNPQRNDFAIAIEVTVKGENTKRPDIVLYVNGIALGVLELKRASISIAEGIRQNLDNQKSIFIKSFFTTMQLVMAGNDTQGLCYATIETPEKYFLSWKQEKESRENHLDRDLGIICEKERFLEIIHDFITFDQGIKKICRYNQYFGIKEAQKYLQQKKGGIIWHTQGSGKSLTMVWLTKWIRENLPNARVLIVTDRDELDDQIEKVFLGVNENIYRTKSGKDLIDQLNATTPWLLCSLIHKFAKKQQTDYDGYIQELKSNLPKDFSPKGDFYVFVDECHRTQSGQLHKAMKEILPNAVLIGFTGTPLLKKDKLKSVEVFGDYIHTYKFTDAVKDGVILDLRYEARRIDLDIISQEKIDKWFEAKTRGLTEYAKTELKKKWGTMQKVLSSQGRLGQIVDDILLDMETKERLHSGSGNALLVSGSIYQACKYYELFQNAGFTKCAIITSYKPSIGHIKGVGGTLTAKFIQYKIYLKMLNGKTPEVFEEEVKQKFIYEPGQMKLLIVVDKLLTGFDAPSATYLYIDKSMQDHGLFQAVCRVNRLDGEDKEYGYIVDYKDLFKNLEKSVQDYTEEAFSNYDDHDVKGLLDNKLKKRAEDLENARESIKVLCEPVQPPKEIMDYIRYFCNSNPQDLEISKDYQLKRNDLYKYRSALIRAYADIANEIHKLEYSQQEIKIIKEEIKYYDELCKQIKLASGDYIDLKMYEPAMRHLIDSYISAKPSKPTKLDDMTLIDLIVKDGEKAIDELPQGIKENKEAVAETIENNLRKVITEEEPINPKYYEKMSVLLEELIQARKEASKNYEDYLRQIIELTKRVSQPPTSDYPASINSPVKRALYDNLNQDESLTLKIDLSIREIKKDSWRGDTMKEREVKNAIKKHLNSEEQIKLIFELVKNQTEY